MIHLEFNSESENEGIARVLAATYMMKFDPTMEEMADVKTNCIVHGYEDDQGKIFMDISNEGSVLKIVIEDFGVGIPDVKQAMEPMYTTKPDEERTGMGFSFMEAFMDKIEVSSESGKGTRVIMEKKVTGK